MRGHLDPQASMFSYFSPEARIPVVHPLRSIKGYADTVLRSLSRDIDELYAVTGRPSIPPERLLKASLLVRSRSSVSAAMRSWKIATACAST